MPGVLKEYINAPVAQWKEQRSSKPKVVGSNPAGGAWLGVERREHFLLEIQSFESPPPNQSRILFGG